MKAELEYKPDGRVIHRPHARLASSRFRPTGDTRSTWEHREMHTPHRPRYQQTKNIICKIDFYMELEVDCGAAYRMRATRRSKFAPRASDR